MPNWGSQSTFFRILFRTATFIETAPTHNSDSCFNTKYDLHFTWKYLELPGFASSLDYVAWVNEQTNVYLFAPTSSIAPNTTSHATSPGLLVQRLCTPHHPMGYARASSWSMSFSLSRLSCNITDDMGTGVIVNSGVPTFSRRRFC
jgi:hypothetical protein